MLENSRTIITHTGTTFDTQLYTVISHRFRNYIYKIQEAPESTSVEHVRNTRGSYVHKCRTRPK